MTTTKQRGNPELNAMVGALAEGIEDAFEAAEVSATVGLSALVTVLLNYSVRAIANGNMHVAGELRLLGQRMIAIADAAPNDVDSLARSLADSTSKH